MAFPTAAGVTSYSGNFIPELWAGKWNVKFYDTTVLAHISNTNYEGIIKGFGDKVTIRQKPDITIRPYRIGQDLEIERPISTKITLQIDQSEYFNCVEDDVDKLQSDMKLLDAWTSDATEAMKITIDKKVLGQIYLDIAASNSGNTAGARTGSYDLGSNGNPFTLSKTNVLDYIVDHGSVLDEANVPREGRFIVIPTWTAGMLKKSDLKDASLTNDPTSVLRNGRLGMIDAFEVYHSNLLPNIAPNQFIMYSGNKDGLTFASQMTEMESMRSERTFGTVLRGLQVYGFKVVKDDALAYGVISK